MHCVLCGHYVVSMFAATSSVLLNGCVVAILIQFQNEQCNLVKPKLILLTAVFKLFYKNNDDKVQ